MARWRRAGVMSLRAVVAGGGGLTRAWPRRAHGRTGGGVAGALVRCLRAIVFERGVRSSMAAFAALRRYVLAGGCEAGALQGGAVRGARAPWMLLLAIEMIGDEHRTTPQPFVRQNASKGNLTSWEKR